MKKWLFSLLFVAVFSCSATLAVFADDSGFQAGGGSASSGGVGRDDVTSSETSSGVGRDDVLSFGGDIKDNMDKYGDGFGAGIDYAKEMWDKTIEGVNRFGLFFAESLGEVLWNDPVFLFYLTITIVGLLALGVIRALTS